MDITLTRADREKIKSLLIKFWRTNSNLIEIATINELTKMILTEDEQRDLQYELAVKLK